MPLTCPSCGNNHNFLVKTLQMHVVRLDDTRVEVRTIGHFSGSREDFNADHRRMVAGTAVSRPRRAARRERDRATL